MGSVLTYNDVVENHRLRGRGFDQSSSLYKTKEGVQRLAHAMTKYSPNPVTDAGIPGIIALNTKFLSIFEYDLQGQNARWVAKTGWVKI